MARSTATVIAVIALLAGSTAFLVIERDANDIGGPATPDPGDADGRRSDVVRLAPRPLHADRSNAAGQAEQTDFERIEDEFVWALGGDHLDRECSTETVYATDPDSGATIEMLRPSCTSTGTEHPYRSYSTDALESLAYSDPVAAVVLGERMWAENADPNATIDMMIRATALSRGQWVHLQWLTAQRFSGVVVNGVPDVRSIHARYVLETVMDRYRPYPRRAEWYGEVSDAYAIPEADLQRLDRQADLLIQRIRKIQRDVMGLTDMEVDEHAQSIPEDP